MVLYCWFARDIMAAMLMVKNKSISLFCEQNSIFMYITQEKICCIDPQHGRVQLSHGCKPRIPGKGGNFPSQRLLNILIICGRLLNIAKNVQIFSDDF